MKKVVIFGIFFILVLSVGLYYYREKSAVSDEITQADEIIKPKENKSDESSKDLPPVESAIQKKERQVNEKNRDDDNDQLADDMLGSGTGENNPQNEHSLTEEEADKMTAYFESTEKAWNERMEHFIVSELSLPTRTLKDYKVLREGYDRDKMEAFEDFHKYMRDRYGDGYSYNPTKDEEKFANKVKDKYDTRLRQLFGQDNYLRYREVREEFNKKLRKEQNPEIGVLFMDI